MIIISHHRSRTRRVRFSNHRRFGFGRRLARFVRATLSAIIEREGEKVGRHVDDLLFALFNSILSAGQHSLSTSSVELLEFLVICSILFGRAHRWPISRSLFFNLARVLQVSPDNCWSFRHFGILSKKSPRLSLSTFAGEATDLG